MPKLFQMLKQVNTIRSNLIWFGVLINFYLDFLFLFLFFAYNKVYSCVGGDLKSVNFSFSL